MTTPIYKGEAILRSRGENDKGRWVRIEIEDDGGVHPFKGLEGERFAVVIVGPLASTDHGQDASESEDTYRRASNSIAPVVGVEPGGDSVPSIAAPPGIKRKTPSQRAWLMVQDAEFQAYVAERWRADAHPEAANYHLANYCGIDSKSQLDTDEHSAKQFDKLAGDFRAWKQAKGHGQLER